jgi:chaperone required for assembly of F1-ATPase
MTSHSNDWFPPSQDEARDPIRTAQQAMKPVLSKRFYREAAAEARDGAFVLLLDGRTAKTPAKNLLALPTRALAEAVAEEWRRQAEVIDPSRMPVTRIVNSALDGVEPRREAVVDDLVRYAGSDLTCYRAGEPERLVREQAEAWDPVLAWADQALGARFILSEGVMYVTQPEAALAAVRAEVDRVASPFALAALHVMTTLTGSVLIALAHAAGRLTAEEAWRAAHADEFYQESLWGEDELAMERHAAREVDFKAASAVYAASAPTAGE